MKLQKILLAGGTGYLGGYILKQLVEQKYDTRVIVRRHKSVNISAPNLEVINAEATRPETLKGVFDKVDVVISTLGITRQKDGLTYMDVDYQGNLNLLKEAETAGVKKFIYVSVLNGEKLRNLKICEAKEKFADCLKASPIAYCVIRPNGFFSDMGDFLKMAKGGKVYLFGDGRLKLNPIHGADLAEVCINAIASTEKEINVGGPDMLSQNDIGKMALEAYGKPPKIVHLPDWLRRFILWSLRIFTTSQTYGPIEFFMTTMVIDMQAPLYGNHRLADYFRAKADERHS